MPVPGGPAPAQDPVPRQRHRSPWRSRRLWTAVLVAGALVAGGAVWQRQRSAVARADLTPYTVLARRESLPGVVTASGELDAVERVNVSPRRQGQVQALFVDEGDAVREGQPLARMDDGDLSDRLDELRAEVFAAEARLTRSRNEWQRRRQLYESGAISADEYSAVLTTYQVDRAALAATRERLEQRGVEQGELIVRAPFAGVISQRFADAGAFVTPTTTASATAGATSSSIVELARGLQVVAKVPESDLGRLRLGMSASVRVDAFPDRRFAARIRQIAPRAVKVNNVTSFEVKLELLNPPPELRIGMTADVDFQTGRMDPETVVPTVAIVTEEGKPGVLLVGKDREPRFQAVELGSSSGRDTQVLGGLEPGTRVFIDLPPWAKKQKR
ncbi:MAG: efflux RND transporter periplasmic adaptor subunit [Synechococcaceae cyanobacterium]|nr:efflux RND transporter periplasmic adaptor subunit [Synechococcaceae cyanobacterium]